MFEVGDIVVALDHKRDMIVESVARVVAVYKGNPEIIKTVRVDYWKTSPLYRNYWDCYFEHELKKLTAYEAFHLLQVRERMVKFKSMKEGVL